MARVRMSRLANLWISRPVLEHFETEQKLNRQANYELRNIEKRSRNFLAVEN